MTDKLINVVIADDHQLVLEGLELLLESVEGIRIASKVQNGRELLSVLQEKLSDLVLLDINMPKLDGLEAMKEIRKRHPQVKIIVLSTYKEKYMIEKAIELGARGYLLKNCGKQELLDCILTVAEGGSCFNIGEPEVTTHDENDEFVRLYNLTDREIEIMLLVKKGFTNKEIAKELFRSVDTIETHRRNFMKKLNLKSTIALINFLNERGID
jgi:two-component system, NarL family, nitrate/nitrite response regulator NarL